LQAFTLCLSDVIAEYIAIVSKLESQHCSSIYSLFIYECANHVNMLICVCMRHLQISAQVLLQEHVLNWFL
uniref:Ovule protein n=1 Tax=Ascaris lumbricoides TaxID=6252 RepID=A0A0M3HMF3_ASCLU